MADKKRITVTKDVHVSVWEPVEVDVTDEVERAVKEVLVREAPNPPSRERMLARDRTICRIGRAVDSGDVIDALLDYIGDDALARAVTRRMQQACE